MQIAGLRVLKACGHHPKLDRLLPGPHKGLETLDKWILRVGDLWQARQSPNDPPETDEGAHLLKPLALGVKGSAGTELSHFDRAALMNFVQQLQILDLATRELLRTMRVLAGLDPIRGFRPQSLPPDLYRPSRWDPHRVVKALFPTPCFVAAYFFWIYVDPPGGTQVPSMVISIAFNFILTPMNPIAMLKVLLVVMWVVLAPIYFVLMPGLDKGFGLLLLMLVYTFVFGYLGGRSPVLKLIPIVLFVNVTGISNNQIYSFMGLATAAMMLILVMSIIAAGHMLWTPSRPERVVLDSVRRFFKGCYRITSTFANHRPKEKKKGRKRRKRYFESMILPGPRQLQAAEKSLNYKLFPDNDADKVNRLLGCLQQIALRLLPLKLPMGGLLQILRLAGNPQSIEKRDA